jgi:hypothetical protein
MWRHIALAPESGTLCYAKTVLLVNDHKAQPDKLNGILQYGMGAHQNVYAAVLESLENLFTTLALDAAREQLCPQAQSVDETADICKMLL